MKQLITFTLLALSLTVNKSFAFVKETLIGQVSGQVVDNQHQPLAYATVTLLKATDSSLIKGAFTEDNGTFLIEQIADGNYLVATSVVGFAKTYSKIFKITDAHPAINLKMIELQPSAQVLKGVDVTATKPFIEHKLDKTVVNVENSAVSAGNTAMEVLEKSPGVTVDNNGNISLKGKSGVVVMIDGKPTYLSQEQLSNLLKSMNANAISQIEIMTNPSAKYDAAGNAGIINIKLKKNANEGVNGSVIAGYSQGMYAHYNTGANINYKKGKVNLFANYNYSNGTWWNTLDLSRRFYDDGGKNPTTLMRQHSFMKFPNTDQSLKAGMDYSINDKNTVGVMVNANNSKGEDITSGPIRFYDGNNQLDSTAVPTNHNHNKWSSITYNLNYKLEIDTAGQELTANFDYSTFDNASNQHYTTAYYTADGGLLHDPKVRQGNLPSNIDIKSGKIDYTLPIKKTAKLEAGLKSSIVTSDNNVQYQNYNNGKWETDNDASNHFIYKENINAAYINLNKEFKKGWAVQLGLRGEQTISKANQLTIDSVVDRNYFQLFPSVFIKKDINKNNSLSVSYSRRIDRPDYQDLNPFRYYVDDYTYNQGNPFLRPQLTIHLNYLIRIRENLQPPLITAIPQM